MCDKIYDNLDGRETDDPSELLETLMEALREAENLGWHHCPPGTLEGDHYDRLCRRLEWMTKGA